MLKFQIKTSDTCMIILLKKVMGSCSVCSSTDWCHSVGHPLFDFRWNIVLTWSYDPHPNLCCKVLCRSCDMRMCNADQRNTSVRCIQHEIFVFNVIFLYVFHIKSYTEKNSLLLWHRAVWTWQHDAYRYTTGVTFQYIGICWVTALNFFLGMCFLCFTLD